MLSLLRIFRRSINRKSALPATIKENNMSELTQEQITPQRTTPTNVYEMRREWFLCSAERAPDTVNVLASSMIEAITNNKKSDCQSEVTMIRFLARLETDGTTKSDPFGRW